MDSPMKIMDSPMKTPTKKPISDDKKVVRKLTKGADDTPKVNLPRSTWLNKSPEFSKTPKKILYDGDDEQSSGYVSHGEFFRSNIRKISTATPENSDLKENKPEKENKKKISHFFGLRYSRAVVEYSQSSPNLSHSNSTPISMMNNDNDNNNNNNYKSINSINSGNNNKSKSRTNSPTQSPVQTNTPTKFTKLSSRQQSFSTLTRKISRLKLSRNLSRPNIVRATTASFKFSGGTKISRIFSKHNNTKANRSTASRKSDDSSKNGPETEFSENSESNKRKKPSKQITSDSNKNENKNYSNTDNNNTDNNSYTEETGKILSYIDPEDSEKRTLKTFTEDLEGDVSIQGTDYNFFLNTICKLPISSNIFDLELSDISIMFELGEQLGTGGYSVVRSAIDRQTRQKRAIKLVDHSVYIKHRIRMEAEVAVLSVTDHPGIIHLYGVVRTPANFCLVMEQFEGRELFEEIVKRPNGFDEDEACRIITAILEGIDHLHSQGVTHRDIKPENFLVGYDSVESNEISVLKLIDFGFATFQNPDGDMIGSSCGTLDYIAPELLLELPHNQSVDIWSVGVVLYILLCGFPPFFAEDDETVFDLISKGVYDFPSPQWDNVSQEAKHLVTCLLQFDPVERWTASQALSHSWIVRNSLLNSQKMLNMRMQSRS